MRKLIATMITLASLAGLLTGADIDYPNKTLTGTWKTTDFTEWELLQTNTVDALSVTNSFTLESGLVNKLLIRAEDDALLAKDVTIAVYSGTEVDEQNLLFREFANLESANIFTNIATGTNDLGYSGLNVTNANSLLHLSESGSAEYVRAQSFSGGPGTWSFFYDPPYTRQYAMQEFQGNFYVGCFKSGGGGDILKYDGTTWSVAFANPQIVVWWLHEHDGRLWASAYKNLISSADGITWVTNFVTPNDFVTGMETFNGDLYIGTGKNSGSSGEVLKYDGVSFTTNFTGFGRQAWSLKEYNGKLYMGQTGASPDGDVWEYDGISWTKSHDTTHSGVPSLEVYDGKLYAGFNDASGDGDIDVYDGVSWVNSYSTGFYRWVLSMKPYGGDLFAGQSNQSGMGDILKFDGATWTVDLDTAFTGIFSMGTYGNTLYAGLDATAGQIYKYNVDGSTPLDGETANAYTTAGRIASVFEYVPMGVMSKDITIVLTVTSADQTFDVVTEWIGVR